ncbi:hypothetical protein BH09MYX1_BH09MYX1_09070 [soil metagenome]
MRPRFLLAALVLPLPFVFLGPNESRHGGGLHADPTRCAGAKVHAHSRLSKPDPAPASREFATAVAPKRDRRKPAEHVILVVIDGVKWQDVFGQTDDTVDAMPTLQRWMNVDGAVIGAPGVGAPMRATGPNWVSLPGYVELFTGRMSPCQANECTLPRLDTFVDDLQGSSAIVSSWEAIGPIVHTKGTSISAGRHYRVGTFTADTQTAIDAAKNADPYPGLWDYRPDALTADVAIAVLRKREPQFLFVGLGETDEYAHRGEREGYVAAMRNADAFLERLDETLRDEGLASSTAILVTTDHGRADSFRDHGWPWPESKRVWLVAKGAGIEARGAIVAPEERRLANVAPTIRRLLGATHGSEETDEAEPMTELLQEHVAPVDLDELALSQ